MVYQNKGLDEILVKFVLRNYIYMNRTREKEKGDCHEREATEKGQTVMREKRLVKFHHPTCQKFFSHVGTRDGHYHRRCSHSCDRGQKNFDHCFCCLTA